MSVADEFKLNIHGKKKRGREGEGGRGEREKMGREGGEGYEDTGRRGKREGEGEEDRGVRERGVRVELLPDMKRMETVR